MVNMVVSQVCGRDASHGTYMVRQLTVITNHPDAVAPHEGGVESPRVTRGRDISDRVIPQNQCLVTRRLQELATAASSSAAASATWTRHGFQAQCGGAWQTESAAPRGGPGRSVTARAECCVEREVRRRVVNGRHEWRDLEVV